MTCPNPNHPPSAWAVADLYLIGFPFKWREAQKHADTLAVPGTFEWFMAARKRFLELGGMYKHECHWAKEKP